MTPGARWQALAEILEIFLNERKPLDLLLKDYFRERRYAGSKDRRAIQEEAYAFFRQGKALYDRSNSQARSLLIAYLIEVKKWQLEDFKQHFTGAPYHPVPLEAQEKASVQSPQVLFTTAEEANIPAFLWPAFERSFGDQALAEAQALMQEGTFDIRVNPLKTDRDTVLKRLYEQDIEAIPTPHSVWGIRISSRFSLKELDLYQQGLIEVQDEGSQLITFLTQAHPLEKVLDLCAGAGGKTLTLAAMMKNQGQVVATDIDSLRLKRASRRLQRAGVTNVDLKPWSAFEISDPSYDLVVLDVPCSGTGTWRRKPDYRARITKEFYDAVRQDQQEMLNKGSLFLKPGGRLVYITCSLLKEENEDQVHQFLRSMPELTLEKQLRLSPLIHQTDGFYGAVIKKC